MNENKGLRSGQVDDEEWCPNGRLTLGVGDGGDKLEDTKAEEVDVGDLRVLQENILREEGQQIVFASVNGIVRQLEIGSMLRDEAMYRLEVIFLSFSCEATVFEKQDYFLMLEYSQS